MMTHYCRVISTTTLSLLLLLLTISPYTKAVEKPHIQKSLSFSKGAIKKQPEQNSDDISHYYVSEKLDGMRGYWNGTQLISRGGNLIKTPMWFTQNWPQTPMDGELWLGRNTFQLLMSCIKRRPIVEDQQSSCWANVRFMVFDLPKYNHPFSKRVQQMQRVIQNTKSHYLQMIAQEHLPTLAALNSKLNTVIAMQGEGLMLHLASAYYQVGRNKALLKLKRFDDAEATVIAYTEGKGKYIGMMGALQVKTEQGVVFKIGSGFSDDERKNPPAIGSIITYKFNGLTQAGVPRFARFWRIKRAE
ncbi:DNA ligase [Colwellia asteriadis]